MWHPKLTMIFHNGGKFFRNKHFHEAATKCEVEAVLRNSRIFATGDRSQCKEAVISVEFCHLYSKPPLHLLSEQPKAPVCSSSDSLFAYSTIWQ